MTVATFARLPAPTPMRRAWAAIAPVDAYLRRRGFDGPRPLVTSPLLLELVAVRQAPEEPWQPLDPPFELVQTQNSNGIRVLYGSARQKATAPPTRLASAIYRLRLAGPGYQNAEHPLDLLSASDMPPALLELDLLPGPDYPFPPGNTVPGLRWPTLLRGGVLRSDGRGWPGVTVSALGYVEPDGLGSAVTCDDGQWVLPFVDGQPMLEPVSVELRWPAEDGRPPVVLEVNIAQGKTNVLPQTTLRGLVVNAGAVPIAGAEVTVSDLAGGETFPGSGLSDGSGIWSYVFPLALAHGWSTGPRVKVVAKSPSGEQAENEAQVVPGVSVTVPTLRTPS